MNEEGYTVTIPVQFKGKHWTDEKKEEFEGAVETRWSVEFNGISFTVDVVETDRGRRNEIDLKNEKGRAYVTNGEKATLFKNSDEWVMAHEAGHLMGRLDQYTDVDGTSVPHEGKEGYIMAEREGVVQLEDMEAIVGEKFGDE